MAWQFADFDEQPTTVEKIARAEKHLSELRQDVAAAVTKGSSSRDPSPIMTLITSVQEQLRYYRTLPDAHGSGRGAGTIARVKT
jgi:hypothetical protein